MRLSLKEESPDELIHYKKYITLKDIIVKRYPNIIIHGCSNSGKTFLIDYILNKIFGSTKQNNEDKIKYKENTNYYWFDFSNHLKHLMIKKIYSIIQNYDHYRDNINYIVIDNYNDIQDNIQKTIKVFMEKYTETSRFILITNKLISIDPSSRNNCFNIMLNVPSKYDKYIYFKYKLDKEGIKYNDFLLLKKCEKYSIEHLIKLYCFGMSHYEDIYSRIQKKISFILYDSFKIDEIKLLSMNIKELDLDVTRLFKEFLMSNVFCDFKSKLIIKEIAHYNYIIKKSYRDIISIESLLVKLYYILNYG